MINSNLFFSEDIDEQYLIKEINYLNKIENNLKKEINDIIKKKSIIKNHNDIDIDDKIKKLDNDTNIILDYIKINNKIIILINNKLYEEKNIKKYTSPYFNKNDLPTLNNLEKLIIKIEKVKKNITYQFNCLVNELNTYFNQNDYFMDVDLYEEKLNLLKTYYNTINIKNIELHFINYIITLYYHK